MDNAPRGTSGYAGEKDTGGLVKEQVSQGAQQAMDKTQQVAGQVTDQAKSQARSAFDSQKQKVTDNMSHVSQALRTTSDTLEGQNLAPVAGVFDTIASRIDGTSSYLQQRSLDDLMQDAERYARQNPWIFLGGAFAVGLAAARFLKSSAPRPSYGNTYGSYGTPGGYGSGGGYGYADQGSSHAGGSGYGPGNYSSGTDYGTGYAVNDVSTAGTPGIGRSFGGDTLTETDVEVADVVFEPEADTGAINGTTTESR